MKKTNENGIVREYGPVVAVEIVENFKPVVHLSQEIKTTYPGRRMSTNLSTGIFDGGEGGAEFVKTRHCLAPVPAGTTLEQVSAQLKKFPEGVIQSVRTNNINDILTTQDLWAISQGLRTMDEMKDRHETRDTEGNKFSRGEMRVTAAGEVLNDNPPEYLRRFYQRVFVEDKDLRDLSYINMEENAPAAQQTRQLQA